MKRIGSLLTSALVACAIAGCGGGGIQEGVTTENATASGAPPGFKELMEKNAKDMQLKKAARKPTPKAAPEP